MQSRNSFFPHSTKMKEKKKYITTSCIMRRLSIFVRSDSLSISILRPLSPLERLASSMSYIDEIADLLVSQKARELSVVSHTARRTHFAYLAHAYESIGARWRQRGPRWHAVWVMSTFIDISTSHTYPLLIDCWSERATINNDNNNYFVKVSNHHCFTRLSWAIEIVQSWGKKFPSMVIN